MLDGIVPPKPEPAPLEPSRKRATDRARDAYMRHHRQALKREARTLIDTTAKYHGQPIEKVIKMLGCRHWTKLTEEEKGVCLWRGPVHGAKAASSKEAQTATHA